MKNLEDSIFKRGSTTYYFSSKLFPKPLRQDIFKLYSFVRVADDYVDTVPQNKKEFKILREHLEDALDDPGFSVRRTQDDSINERVVKNIVQLIRKYDFDPEWAVSFMDSMQADIDKKQYLSMDGSLWYTYGSAEVIGLMMAKLMGLPDNALPAAAVQGRAMQWINFIRDINEDNSLGRCYFPRDELQNFQLKNLSETVSNNNSKNFKAFINFQLDRYASWQNEARKGFQYIPNRYLPALKTAASAYDWTAQQIRQDPFIVYRKKVKPSRRNLVFLAARAMKK